jgi:hypothetical protein
MSHHKKKRNGRKPRPARSTHPSLFIIGGAALVVAAALLILSSRGDTAGPPATPEVAGAPSLKVDKEKVDLGVVRLGDTVSVSFELTNVGDRQIYFTDKPYVEVVEGC